VNYLVSRKLTLPFQGLYARVFASKTDMTQLCR
jgi:hypothetical protein